MTYRATHTSITNVKYTTWWAQHVGITIIILFYQIPNWIKWDLFQENQGYSSGIFFTKYPAIFTRIKRYCCSKIRTLHHKKIFLRLFQRFSTYLSILKCFKNVANVFLKCLKCIHTRYEHFIALHSTRTKNMNKIKEELLTEIMNISIQIEEVRISLIALNLLKD